MRAQAANLFFYSRMAHATAFLRSFVRKDLPILAYHRICNVPDERAFPFDIELVSASGPDFVWQMEYVAQHFNPITFGTLMDAIEGRALLPPRPIIVTFDDGFDDNYYNAFPVLKALGIPATIFLSTGYIGGRKTFWYDWLAYIVNHVPDCDFDFNCLDRPVRISGDIHARREALCALLDRLKGLTNSHRLEVLADVEDKYGGYYRGHDLDLSRPLTWEQVQEMAANGIEFGSHTVTHPILTSLDDSHLLFELQESKRAIEQKTNRPVETVAYPVGRSFAFDNRVREAARRLGYRLGIAYIRGTNRLSTLDRFALKRIAIERYVDRAQYAAMLCLPEVFST